MLIRHGNSIFPEKLKKLSLDTIPAMTSMELPLDLLPQIIEHAIVSGGYSTCASLCRAAYRYAKKVYFKICRAGLELNNSRQITGCQVPDHYWVESKEEAYRDFLEPSNYFVLDFNEVVFEKVCVSISRHVYNHHVTEHTEQWVLYLPAGSCTWESYYSWMVNGGYRVSAYENRTTWSDTEFVLYCHRFAQRLFPRYKSFFRKMGRKNRSGPRGRFAWEMPTMQLCPEEYWLRKSERREASGVHPGYDARDFWFDEDCDDDCSERAYY